MADATTYAKILYAGTYANYKAIATKDANVLYYCTDNGKFFKGEVDFTDSFVYTDSASIPVAAQAVPGKIYYESDTQKFKVLNSNKTAFLEIGNPIDAVGDSTTHTLSASSSDEHVPSSKNVWLYGQAIKAEVIGGTDVVSNVTASSNDGAIIVTYGDNSTTEVVIPNAITGVTDSTAADAQIIVAKGDTTSAVTVTGVVTTPTWDSTNLKLTLPVSGGNSVEVNIPKDIFLESGSYDVTNKQIVLVLNDASNTEIRFSVEDLIPIYDIADTTTVDMAINWDATNGKHVISADVNVSATAGNGITVENDGLYLDVSGFASTSDLETLEASHNNLAAAFTWGTF